MEGTEATEAREAALPREIGQNRLLNKALEVARCEFW